jgi:hypothetical protein
VGGDKSKLVSTTTVQPHCATGQGGLKKSPTELIKLWPCGDSLMLHDCYWSQEPKDEALRPDLSTGPQGVASRHLLHQVPENAERSSKVLWAQRGRAGKVGCQPWGAQEFPGLCKKEDSRSGTGRDGRVLGVRSRQIARQSYGYRITRRTQTFPHSTHSQIRGKGGGGVGGKGGGGGRGEK